MNTFVKYAPNVFIAKCNEPKQKGQTITMTSKYGKESEHIVHNCLGKSTDGLSWFYSITRADGLNAQDFAKKKAEKIDGYKQNALNKSDEAWKASHEGREFLALAEPIKIGHHSEKRHRALIERNHRRMDKSMELRKKAESYDGKKAHWESMANKIDLSMPESIEYFEFKLEEAKMNHEGLKNGTIEKSHSYSLTYAKKAVNEMQKNYYLAVKLWGNN
jgi:hypothetical protein